MRDEAQQLRVRIYVGALWMHVIDVFFMGVYAGNTFTLCQWSAASPDFSSAAAKRSVRPTTIRCAAPIAWPTVTLASSKSKTVGRGRWCSWRTWARARSRLTRSPRTTSTEPSSSVHHFSSLALPTTAHTLITYVATEIFFDATFNDFKYGTCWSLPSIYFLFTILRPFISFTFVFLII